MRHNSPLSTVSLQKICAFSVLAGVSASSAFAEGFIDDTKATLTFRNFYLNRNFTDPSYPQAKAAEWTQSEIFNLTSGFTTGPVGFGVDVLGLYSLKLDGGGGTSGTGLLPKLDNGGSPRDFGHLNVAPKMRISKTEIKVGELAAVLPVVRSDDARSLPVTFRGAQINSKEIDGLNAYVGQMRAIKTMDSSSMDDMTYGGAKSDRFNYAGGEYTFNDKRTVLGAWYAQLENIYNQRFFQVIHTQPIGNFTLGANVGYFIGYDDGAALAGERENHTTSILLSAKTGAHSFYVGLQRVVGDTWMRIGGTSGGILANGVYNSSFDNAGERSWQVRYDYDFVALGVPGLTLMNRYIKGTNIHTSVTDSGEEWARESELAYVIQSGAAKNLSVRWRNSTQKRDYSTLSFNEDRLIVSYPLNIF
ncbi:OprD family porin [Pseudomonas azerbaijanoccidentalis]